MSSTNKTTNYELSQFLGTDKPAWLNDYNADMNKIDAGIHTAQTTATGADGKADSNTTSIGTLSNLSTEAKTNLVSAINEVDTHADTAQGTASNAYTLADTANTTANYAAGLLNLGAAEAVTWSGFTPTFTNVAVSKNSDGSICKIYGSLRLNATNGWNYYSTTDTGLRPDTEIVIQGAGFVVGSDGNPRLTNIKIATNGVVSAEIYGRSSGDDTWLYLINSIIVVKDLGDQPNA